MAEPQTRQTGLNGPWVQDYQGFAGGWGGVGNCSSLPITARWKGPREEVVHMEKGRREAPAGDPQGCARERWEKQPPKKDH